MVGAQERDDDRPQMHRHKPKASDIPPLQREPFVLNAEATEDAKLAGPLGVEFAFEVEGDAFVGEVPGDDEECKCDPAEEGIEPEEGGVVEDDPGPASECGENAY